MPGAGIQSLTLALSCLLIICTGTLIGSITITTWNDLLRKARDNGDEGVSQCLNSGELDIKAMSGRFLHAVLEGVESAIDKYFEVPEMSLRVVGGYVEMHHPNVSTSPAFVDKQLRPLLKTLFDDTVHRGVTNIAYEALPFSPAYPHPLDLARSYPWGGNFVYFRAMAASGIQRNDTPIALLLETRDMFTNTFQHGPLARIGEAGPDGNMWNTQRGCNYFSDYENDIWLGNCMIPRAYSGADYRMTELLTGDIKHRAGTLEYAPAKANFNEITLSCTYSPVHPEMLDLYPGQNRRVGYLGTAFSGKGLTEMLVEQDLPEGSLIYTVQHNYRTGAVGELIAFNAGWVGATYMQYYPPPINSTLPNQRLINITNHSDIQGGSIPSAIASHGRYAFSLDGGYDETVELSKDAFHPWMYVPEANATNATRIEFWTVTKEYTRGSPVTLTWYVTLLVPRSAVMAKIDVSTSSIKAQNEESRQDSEDKQNEALVTMLAATLSAAAVLLAVSVFVTRMIISPLLSLQHDMSCVAVMNLEGVDLESKSRLSEVANMQASFKMMVSNLIEYRNYMPQTVLLSEGDEDVVTMTHSSMVSAKLPPNHSRLSKSLSESSKHIKAPVAEGLRRKHVSVAYFNIKDWHAYCGSKDDDTVVEQHSKVVGMLMQSAQLQKGVCDVFSGDRMLVTFNAYKAAGSHKECCANSARHVSSCMEKENIAISFACATGDARVGHMGCAGMKKITVTSSVVSWVIAMERYNRKMDYSGLYDSFIVKGEIAVHFSVKCVDALLFTKRSSKNVQVFEIMGDLKVAEEEWMYQLENTSGIPFAIWNETMTLLIDGKYADAKEKFAKIPSDLDKVCVVYVLYQDTTPHRCTAGCSVWSMQNSTASLLWTCTDHTFYVPASNLLYPRTLRRYSCGIRTLYFFLGLRVLLSPSFCRSLF